MNRLWLVVPGLAALVGGAYIARSRARLIEDLRWADVPKPGRIIDVNGYGVHVVEAGEGPPMVLIHGFGGQTYSYRALMPLFARDHRVIAVDLKGYGYSERSVATGLSATDQVAMLHALLGKLGVDRAIFVGHSMGGGVVQRFAAMHPEMVEAAVLAASVDTERQRRVRNLAPGAILRPLLPYLGKFATNRILRASYHDDSLLTPEVADEYKRPGRIAGSMDGLFKMMQDYRNDGPIDFERITIPVLLLYAAQDRIVPLFVASGIRERIPQARLVVIDQAGHMLLEEKPAECERAIRDFLAAARTGEGMAVSAR